MILFLRALFIVVLASMLWVTTWASFQCPLFAVPREVYTHPWFIATLVDAYWGFITFYVWVAYQRTSWLARASWLIAILLLGNMAMAAYCLAELWRTPREGSLGEMLIRRRDGPGVLGPALAVLGSVVILVALPPL